MTDTVTGEIVSIYPHPEALRGENRGLTRGEINEYVLTTRAEVLGEFLIASYPWVLDTDMVAVEQYCRNEAMSRLIYDWIMERISARGVDGVPPGIWTAHDKAENRAAKGAESLGLTPLGRMKIAKDAGFAHHFAKDKVGSLAQQGAALRAAGGRET